MKWLRPVLISHPPQTGDQNAQANGLTLNNLHYDAHGT